MSAAISFLDLSHQHGFLAQAMQDAFAHALAENAFVGGPAVSTFEQEFARYCQAPHCVGLNSGTDALVLALKALGVGAGDKVLVPTYTFIATAEAASILGAIPVFVDVVLQTFSMDADALAAVSDPAVRAVVPVHLYGHPADMDAILKVAKQRGWGVVEDAAQAHGAEYKGRRVGSLGDIGAFSFYPTKNLGALGDGGAVTGADATLIERLRRLANHGRTARYDHAEPGYNSRLDAIQAMALSLKLAHLDAWNRQRQQIARWYIERLEGQKDLQLPRVAEGCTHVYHLFSILAPERDRLIAALQDAEIGVAVHYATPLHLQPAYRDLGHGPGDFPVAESVAQRVLSLPLYPGLAERQVDRVAAGIIDHMKAGG